MSSVVSSPEIACPEFSRLDIRPVDGLYNHAHAVVYMFINIIVASNMYDHVLTAVT